MTSPTPPFNRTSGTEPEDIFGPAGQANSARRYNHWLGGKDNLAPDRASAATLQMLLPDVRAAAGLNRQFVLHAVERLAQAGVSQFIDIGCGHPFAISQSGHDIHTIARRHQPHARVLYVDNDPIVGVHARVFLDEPPETAFVNGDLSRPETFLDHPRTSHLIHPDQPVAVLLGAVLHYLCDQNARTALNTLTRWLPAGSRVVLTHATTDLLPDDTAAAVHSLPVALHGNLWPRDHAAILDLLGELHLEEPGLIPTSRWHCNTLPASTTDLAYAAILAGPQPVEGRQRRR